MSQTYTSKVWIAFLFIAAAVYPAQPQDIRLNILKSDEFALRRMVVFKKSGEKIGIFVRIASFDPATGLFVMESATGDATSIPATEIQKIEFEQTVKRQNPAAQQASWEIRATLGAELRYDVSQSALKVESGDLVLPSSSPSTSIPGPTLTPSEASPRKSGNKTTGVSITNVKVLEAKSLTVNGSSKSFFVEVQNVTYTKETSGSSVGLSGMRK